MLAFATNLKLFLSIAIYFLHDGNIPEKSFSIDADGEVSLILYYILRVNFRKKAVKTSDIRLKAGFAAEIKMINWRTLEYRRVERVFRKG